MQAVILKLPTIGILLMAVALNRGECQSDTELSRGAKVSPQVESESIARKKDAQDEKAIAVVEKAANAHGGNVNLKKLRISKTSYSLASDISYFIPGVKNIKAEVEETYQLPNQVKKVIKTKIDGKDVNITWAVDGDSYWSHSDEDHKTVIVRQSLNVEKMFRPYLEFELLETYRAQTIWKFAGFRQFRGQQTVAVEAKCEALDYEATLYFDKSTGLLAGTMTYKTTLDKSKEFAMEVHLTNYKDSDGLRLPMRQHIFINGEQKVEIAVKNVRLLDRIDPAVFMAPE